MNARRPLVAFCVLPLLSAGCGDSKVASYSVPKEKEPAPAVAAMAEPTATAPMAAAPMGAPSGMANTAVPTASGTSLSWTAPTNWKLQAASAMRKATYALPGEGTSEAELAITAFPGDVGGELANVNRWRGQIDLPPIDQAGLATAVTRIEKNGLKIAILDAGGQGATPKRLLGAMIPFGGATWFFKITGPNAIVTKEKPAFLSFLETVKPAAP